MGTNYYAATTCEHCGQHIGKRSSIGGGACVFTWAVERDYLNRMPDAEGAAAVENEYGDHFTLEEFRTLVEACRLQDYDHIGVEFS